MDLVVAGETLSLVELLSKHGNPYWGLAVEGDNGQPRYASAGIPIDAQGERLPALVFLAGQAVMLDEDPDRPSRVVEDCPLAYQGRAVRANVRLTVRRDGRWNVTASVGLARSELVSPHRITLHLSAGELARARAAASAAGKTFDQWVTDLIRRSLDG
jgi:hypothetical protein